MPFQKNFLLLLFIPLFLFKKSAAQSDSLPPENWDVYMAKYEKGAGSVLLNLSLKPAVPVKGYGFIIITGVTFSDCTAEGFPSNRAFTTLYRISDSVKAVIDRYTTSIIAGTFTYQCERLDYIYVKDTTWIREKLLKLYAIRFPGYKPYINIKVDQNWDGYLKFLYPNEETLDYMGNQKVIMALQRAGDKLDKARTIDHWAYFKSDADRICFITYLTKNRFKVIAKENTGSTALPYKIQFSRMDKPDPGSITKITLALRKQAGKCQGEYDGWETVVIK